MMTNTEMKLEMSFVFKFSSLQVQKYQDFKHIWSCKHENMCPKPITLTQNCTVRFRAILMMMTNTKMSFVFKFSSLQVRNIPRFFAHMELQAVTQLPMTKPQYATQTHYTNSKLYCKI